MLFLQIAAVLFCTGNAINGHSFSSYLTRINLRFHYKKYLLSIVYINSSCLRCVSDDKLNTINMWTKHKACNVEADDVCGYHCAWGR
jgi:hypothetical protein